MPKLKYYTVTMQVEVSRQVLATSEDEACDKVDTSDMVYEIKNYGFSENVTAKEVSGLILTEYDIIEDIGEQIVKESPYSHMSTLKEMYQEIVAINRKFERVGKPTKYIPFSIKDRMTQSFIDELTNIKK